MNKYVADSMAFILRLEKRKMPKGIKKIFIQAEKEEAEILIPTMVLAEVAYLAEKGRIDTTLEKSKKYLNTHANINESPMTLSTILHAFQIHDIPELHDRLISATGKEFVAPVLSNDPALLKCENIECIWR